MIHRVVRWCVLVVLLYGLVLPTRAPAAAPGAASSVPASLSAADWQSIQAQLPHALAAVPAQQAYLKASQVSASDAFGFSVAVSGDTAVVGILNEDSSTPGVQNTATPTVDETVSESGAAYVFVRSGSTWSQQAYLKASQVSQYDQFGWSVAVSGDTIVVGAPSEGSSTPGVQNTASPIVNEAAFRAGAAYVFGRSGSTWSQQAYLKASQVSANDYFGTSVAVSGDTIVVGAPSEGSSTPGVQNTASPIVNETATDAGAAFVFGRTGSTWSQQAYLKASQVDGGDQFGRSVAVSGDTMVVGAIGESSSTPGVQNTDSPIVNEGSAASGAAYVFRRSGSAWSQQAYLKASQVSTYDVFGASVAVSSDTIVVGAPYEASSTPGVQNTASPTVDVSASKAGAAFVFRRSGSTWSQQAYLKASQVSVGDIFGFSVAVSGNTIVVGAPYEDSSTPGMQNSASPIVNENADDAGAAFVFGRSGSTWSQHAYLKASQVSVGDIFGFSVAVSGDTVVVGSHFEGSSTPGVQNSASPTVDETANVAGAAFVFAGLGPTAVYLPLVAR